MSPSTPTSRRPGSCSPGPTTRPAWLGAEVELDPTPGAAGRVVDHDGTCAARRRGGRARAHVCAGAGGPRRRGRRAARWRSPSTRGPDGTTCAWSSRASLGPCTARHEPSAAWSHRLAAPRGAAAVRRRRPGVSRARWPIQPDGRRASSTRWPTRPGGGAARRRRAGPVTATELAAELPGQPPGGGQAPGRRSSDAGLVRARAVRARDPLRALAPTPRRGRAAGCADRRRGLGRPPRTPRASARVATGAARPTGRE